MASDRYIAREPSEEELLSTLETIGDTPSTAVYRNGVMVCLIPGDVSGKQGEELAQLLESKQSK